MKLVRAAMRTGPVTRKLLTALLTALSVILLLHLLLQFLNLNVYHEQNGPMYELSNRFDLDDESSVPTWFTQFLFLATAVVAGLAAWLQTNRRRRLLWGLIAFIALIFSIDEVATMHEFVLQTLHVAFLGDGSPSLRQNAWLLAAPFVLLGGLGLVWLMWKHFPRRAFILLALAGGIFVMGAMGIDILTSTGSHSAFMSQGIMVAIEEGLELVGLILALTAVVDYLEREYPAALPDIARVARVARR